MFSSKDNSIIRSTAFRLTLWYAVIFAVAAITVYCGGFLSIKSHLDHRVDEELLEDLEEYEELYSRGIEFVRTEMEEDEQSDGIEQVFVRILNSDLSTYITTDLRHWTKIDEVTATIVESISDRSVVHEIKLPNRDHRARIACKKLADGKILQTGLSMEDDEELLLEFTVIFGVVIFFMTLTGCVIGWLMARKAMAGVQRVTNSARSIATGDLSHRVDVGSEGAEIEQLATTFNDMIERIETLITEITDVTNNIAHDLRSPITRIRLVVEQTLTQNADIESYQQMAASVTEECDRLVVMIKTMLEMAEMDAGVAKFTLDQLDVVSLAEDAIDLFKPVADKKKIKMTINSQHESVFVNGNKSMLQRVIANLLDNSLKFTPDDGEITIEIRNSEEQVDISVIDSGVIIASDDLPHIFKPFFRADESRSTPGNGLGLSLARSIIAAHSGEITVTTLPGKGNKFTVLLPPKFFP